MNELIQAVIKNDAGNVKQILSSKKAPSLVASFKDNPLYLAAGSGHITIVKILIDYGAPVDHIGYCYKTPLYGACKNKDYLQAIEIAKYLLSNGAKLNDYDNYIPTPLHAATISKNIALIKILVEAGAKVNALNQAGNTALHIAAQKPKNDDLILCLLKFCRNIDIKNRSGKTPFDLIKSLVSEKHKSYKLFMKWYELGPDALIASAPEYSAAEKKEAIEPVLKKQKTKTDKSLCQKTDSLIISVPARMYIGLDKKTDEEKILKDHSDLIEKIDADKIDDPCRDTSPHGEIYEKLLNLDQEFFLDALDGLIGLSSETSTKSTED